MHAAARGIAKAQDITQYPLWEIIEVIIIALLASLAEKMVGWWVRISWFELES